MEKGQEEKNKNFDPETGEKINPTCEFCWVKKIKNYNCGFKKCPGYNLLLLETSKKKK